MVERAIDLLPSTPPASAAVAQTREGLPSGSIIEELAIHWPGENTDFVLGDGVRHAVYARPYERKIGDPVYRPLKIFTLDPSRHTVQMTLLLDNKNPKAEGKDEPAPEKVQLDLLAFNGTGGFTHHNRQPTSSR